MRIRLLIITFLLTALFGCQIYQIQPSEEDLCIKRGNLDTREHNRLKNYYPLTLMKINRSQLLELDDIENMTKSGVSDDAIIAEINETRSIFYLTKEDIEELQQEGVSKRVIKFMQDTGKVD